MKTVRDACQLQPNALSIKLSDQIEQLDELISAEGDGIGVLREDPHHPGHAGPDHARASRAWRAPRRRRSST